ncbi:uncharacterized protein MONOS_12401 [Monocercomonoides exilis]|uniref:uncharacterized protein n=1 Tax=Monocercomonoides exilis TaxID=2049356 RepID=UPI00355A05AF|nr:hypothetical protein MONOS_12401 [Monocercomonoides exilis]|eukprot:MONOS_12401.1-p1 / transcript=MONOS_12401.1 / gene=MONOS_12401 / organism=Monocercomonoides_exilis_PA203 / gene_product=unspecified product / transcript_product=unspecified product / location=Mono_scaffold00685:3672-4556(-) / protein_length=295 / sequence_SO=supercontig / SO=protein_coding / is_pseudo=false
MENDIHLELFNIQLHLTSGFDNSAKTIISNKGGELVIRECSFHSEAVVNKRFDCVFVDVIGGSVDVKDEGSFTQEWLVGCSSSLTMSRLSFVVKGQLKTRRNSFIHSTSTINMTNCSVSFESGELIDGMIGYSIIKMTGGNLIADGFVMKECVLTKCVRERSTERGGMKMLMKRGDTDVKGSGCLFGMCVCSTGNGRGKWMMIDALDLNGECSNTKMPALGLRLENIRFMMNDAFVGKDVFIKCHSIGKQVNKTLFELNFSQEALKGENSMCGSDGEGKVDVDLMLLITFNYSS